MANELDYLKIYSQHLIKTGFLEHFNKFIDQPIISIEYIQDENILRYKTNINEIDIPFNISLSNLMNVDVSGATSGNILIFNGQDWVAQEQSEALSYIRTEDSYRFPDIKSQQIYSVESALDAILYPYKEPSFNTFSITNKSSVLELGQELSSISDSFTFVWTTTNTNNISSDGYNILDITGSKTLATDITPTSLTTETVNIDYIIVRDTISSYTFQINTQNSKNNTFSRNYSVSWRPKMFWGYSANTTLDSNDIRDLQSYKLTTTATGTYTIDGNGQYIYFVCPESFGSLIDADGSNTRFLVGNLPNSSFIRTTINYTNTYNHTESYYIYRTSTIQYGQGIEIKIT